MITYNVRVHLPQQIWQFEIQARDDKHAEDLVDLITYGMDFSAIEIH